MPSWEHSVSRWPLQKRIRILFSEEVLSKKVEEIKRRYARALEVSNRARAELKAALHAMHSIGEYPPPPRRLRFPLNDERAGGTHKIEIGAGDRKLEGYVTTGTYSDGTLGEIFILAEKHGALVSGLMDGFATVFSIALQSGVPLERLTDKLMYTRFEPAGVTRNPDIGMARSILDYLMQWLDQKYNKPKEEDTDGEPVNS